MRLKTLGLFLFFLFFLFISAVAGEGIEADSITVQKRSDGDFDVTFSFKPKDTPQKVSLAGNFNNWRASSNPMKGPDEKGRFSLTLPLQPGTHYYKFVINGNQWIPDPENNLKIDDGHQGSNSVIILGDASINDVVQPKTPAHEPDPDFKTPEWAKDVVWYQIFPERFRNGCKKNDPPNSAPWTSAWFKIHSWEKGEFYQPIIWERRYGGDLQGVMKKLDYLQKLGVSAIYFNPLFEAPSLHKYDCSTYMHIDDNFGYKDDNVALREDWLDPETWVWTKTDQLFLKLIEECHKRGIKVIIDGVFNHCGEEFLAFLDVKLEGKDSKFSDWFDIESWEPFKHKGWAGFGFMPEFREGPDGFSLTFKKHLFDITTRWMDPNGDGDPSDGIDGWRLDVPFDVNRKFWDEWRGHVKSVNPEAYITGEIWGEPASWVGSDAFDATMNYDFSRAGQAFFIDKKNRISVSRFDNLLHQIASWVPPQSAYAMQNLYDSHDTDRLASQIKNPDRTYDQQNRLQDESGANYNADRPGAADFKVMRLMTIFQMTWVGAPMIYYGSEVGMFGPDDPTNRKPMLWKDLEPYENPKENFVDGDLLDFHKKIIAIRNTYPALRRGEFHTALLDDDADVYAFWRVEENYGGKRILIVLNNSNAKREITIEAPFPEGFIFHDILKAPGKFKRKPMPSGKGKWMTFDMKEKKAPASAINKGEISLTLEAKDAAILVSEFPQGD